MIFAYRPLTISASFFLAIACANARDWPQWRGPAHDGSTASRPLPDIWSTTQNIAWRTDLPGTGFSTPVVTGDRVFLTTVNNHNQNVYAVGIDAVEGTILWTHGVGRNSRRGNNDATSPSPVTDGERVIFTFGTGQMLAFTLDGELIWEKELRDELGNFSIMFGYGASPLLHHGVIYFPLLRRPYPYHGEAGAELPLESYLVAIRADTGKELWRHVRPSDAVHESFDSYITPVPFERNGEISIILVGGDAVTAHALNDGRELWRWVYNEGKARNWRVVPSPVVHDDLLIIALPRGSSLFGARITEEGITDESISWTLRKNMPDVCTPLIYDGLLYILDGDRQVMSCVDPESGNILYQEPLGSRTVMRASPTAGDNKVYSIDERGEVFVITAGKNFSEPTRINMGGSHVRSSIAIAQGRLFIRTSEALYCVLDMEQ